MEDLRAAACQDQHLVVGNLRELDRVGVFSRVTVVNAVHVGVDAAAVGVEKGRQGDGGGVGAAASQGGDVIVAVHPLKACHQDDVARLQLPPDPVVFQAEDPRITVTVLRFQPRLPAAETDGGYSQPTQGHGAQADGALFPRCKKHIQLPSAAVRVDLPRPGQKRVCRAALGGQHADHLMPLPVYLCQLPGGGIELLCVRHGASTEFHNIARHFLRPPSYQSMRKEEEATQKSVYKDRRIWYY